MTLVLIVEDNPINRDVLGRRLERRGYNIRFAEDGPDGIAAALKIQPDIILMDIDLPDIDGITAFKKLQENVNTQSIPVLAVSSNAMKTEIENALDAGFRDYIIKPINVFEFVNKVEALLENKK